MDLSNLKAPEPNKKKAKRIGRGQGSGRGGHTVGKGHNGQRSRSGFKEKFWFEGGQMPLYRRIPKFGFRNINRVEYKPVNLSTLENLARERGLSTIDLETLYNAGLAKKGSPIKILGKGELSTKLEVKAHAFSKSAKEAIESVQGTAVKL